MSNGLFSAVLVLASGVALAAAQSTSAAGPQEKAAPGMTEARVTGHAHADISGNGVTGSAEFTERTSGTGGVEVEVIVRAKGMTPGLHGVHLHAVGTCEAPGFTSAGGHFDPGPAGNTDPDANHPFHMGDLPNLRADASGAGTLRWRTTRVTLSDGPLSLFDADGAAIVIHANQDQYVTGASKSGVSGGPRAACGVIQKK